MLHILLLILKIVGIILAVILGILLLLIGIVLFVPIRYDVSAKCDGTIDSLRVKGKAAWLLHLLQADVWVKGTKLKWQVRTAWIKKSNAMTFGNRKEGAEHEAKEEKSDDIVQKVEKADVKDKICEESAKSAEEKCEVPKEAEEERLEESSEETSKTDSSASDKSEKESVGNKIKKIIEKIKLSIRNLCDKVKELLQKKEKITDFLTDESHVRAFQKAKKALFILLKRLKPKKINIKLHFGFEDPSTTGKVLAVLSILYPFLGDTTEIHPDFEKQILEGKVYLQGRIRICHFVWMALKLLLSKDVRISYKDIRNFKL